MEQEIGAEHDALDTRCLAGEPVRLRKRVSAFATVDACTIETPGVSAHDRVLQPMDAQ